MGDKIDNAPVVQDGKSPAELVVFGKSAASALKAIVKDAKLNIEISGRDYLKFEGWQTVAKFFGASVGIEWSKPIANGWEARAVVYDKDNKIISAAESSCGRDEKTWATRPDFAVRSMAQTRASSKALRNVFAWVVVLAGLEATPAEEMTGSDQAKPINTATAAPKPAPRCQKCNKPISDKVAGYSMEKFGGVLCFDCQKNYSAAPKAEPDKTKTVDVPAKSIPEEMIE